jgi:uncharacterized protein (TIGR02246 family)
MEVAHGLADASGYDQTGALRTRVPFFGKLPTAKTDLSTNRPLEDAHMINARYLSACLVCFLLIFALRASTVSTVFADEKADFDALGQLNESYVTAFNRQDAAAVANAFAEGGDMLILTGDLLEGREAIAKGHSSFFANNRQAKIAGKQLHRRFLTPDVAVARGEWKVSNGPAQFPSKGLWTAVQVKTNGSWRYASLTLTIPVQAK